MVNIPMSQNNKLEVTWLAARAFKFFFDNATFVGPPRVNQDMTVAAPDKVAIYMGIKNNMSGNGFNL
jgi:hypothetical protein